MFCGKFGRHGKDFTPKTLLSKYFLQMDMATAGLERAKETRCESLASRRCAPDFSQSGGGRAGGLEQVGRGLGGGGCG